MAPRLPSQGSLLLIVLFAGSVVGLMWYFNPDGYAPRDKNPAAAQDTALQAPSHSSGINLAIIEKDRGAAEEKIRAEQEKIANERRKKIIERYNVAEKLANQLGINDNFFPVYLGISRDKATTEAIVEKMRRHNVLSLYTDRECIRPDGVILDWCIYETFLLERVARNDVLKNALFTARTSKVKTNLTMGNFAIGPSSLSLDVTEDDRAIIAFLLEDTTPYLSNK